MEIIMLDAEYIEPAMALVREVFGEFEAPEYESEGVETFMQFIEHDSILFMIQNGSLKLWGCFADGELAGVIAVRGENHICLLFVKKEYHHQGFATALFSEAFSDCTATITVNSSPYAAGFYHSVGFEDVSEEKTENGIRFIPMINNRYKKEKGA